MGSIDETMLNIQLYRKTYLFYNGLWVVRCLYVLCVVALLTFWSVCGECVLSHVLSRIYFTLFMWNIHDFIIPWKCYSCFVFALNTFIRHSKFVITWIGIVHLCNARNLCLNKWSFLCLEWRFQSSYVLHCREVGRLLIRKRYGGRLKGMVWWAGFV